MGPRAALVVHRAVRAHQPEVSDRELLRRFAEEADQAAFAALVRRHAPMVLGVCRRALHNAQDAEDACQATFLLLTRKARAGRWQPSIANWLYAAARKVARNARVAAERRARREGRAAVPEAARPLDQMTGRDLLAVLDEELDRLPPHYREPLVLCYLQGLTRDEAAARLGIPPATLKSQLDRGRKRLAVALTRRGVTLGAGLLALAATSRAGASPPRLVEGIRAAAAGKVSPAVAALAEGVAVNGVVWKSLLGAVVLAAAAVIGLGAGGPTTTTAGPPPERAMPAKAAAPGNPDAPGDKPAADKTRTITGQVLDPDGKPVAGAEIVHLPIEGTPTVAGKTAADGTFKVTVPLKEPGSYLFPRVAGFASGEYLMPATNTPAEKTFRLVKDTPIRGRVLDTQGKPVAGATVVVRHLAAYGDTLDQFLNAWQKRSPDSNGPGSKWLVNFRSWQDTKPAVEDGLFAVRTDRDGRFTIANVGSERLATLHVRGPGIADMAVAVVLRAGFDPAPYNQATAEKLRSPYSELGYHPMFHAPDLTVVAEAAKPIRGTVTEVGTGKPRAGVKVTLQNWRNQRLPDLTATTDDRGRYEIHGAKKATKYELVVRRDVKAGTLGRTVTAPDTPAYEPVTADVAVAKGVVLTGRILDGATKEPVPGFVCVGVLVDNPFVKDRPELASPDCYDQWANADEAGVYRTVVPPGPVLLMAGPTPRGDEGSRVYTRYRQMRPDPAYPQYFDMRLSGFHSPGGATTMMQGQYCKVLKLDPGKAEATADVILERATTFTVKVQGPDGKPATDVMVAGNTARDWMYPTPCDGDTCSVYELDTAKPRLVVLYDRKANLAAAVRLTGAEKEPLVVKLGPLGTIKGKLADAAGRPIANAIVRLGFRERPAGEINQLIHGGRRDAERLVETNAAGEFTLDRVLPGLKFHVYGQKGNKDLEPPNWKVGGFEAKGGETTDVGTVKLKVEGGE